jgi:hypothetical protein
MTWIEIWPRKMAEKGDRKYAVISTAHYCFSPWLAYQQ